MHRGKVTTCTSENEQRGKRCSQPIAHQKDPLVDEINNHRVDALDKASANTRNKHISMINNEDQDHDHEPKRVNSSAWERSNRYNYTAAARQQQQQQRKQQ